MDWDTFYMTLVNLVSMKSRDKSTHVGAVIVSSDNTIVSMGYNGLPRGVEYKPERTDLRPEKYDWFEHAETNAIHNAARTGARVVGATMYTNGVPCPPCARATIQAGIKKVIVDTNWGTSFRCKHEGYDRTSRIMLQEAGVEIIEWDGEIVREIYKFVQGEKL